MPIFDPGLFIDGTPLKIIDYFLGMGISISLPIIAFLGIAQLIKRS